MMTGSAETLPHTPSPARLWPARLGWLLIALFVLSLLVANVPYQVEEVRRGWQVGEAWPFARTFFGTYAAFARWLVFWRMATGAVFFGTALLLAWRKWRDPVVLLFSADLLILGAFYSLNFDIDRIRFPAPLTEYIPNLDSISVMLILGAMLSLFYLFPNGRFEPRSWRWLAWLVVANALLWALSFSFERLNRWLEGRWPVLRSGDDEWGWILFTGSIVLALGVGLAAQAVRYRRVSAAEQRQQTKWAILGLAALLVGPFGIFLVFGLVGIDETPLAHFLTLHLELVIVLVPITITFSMLRYRLWDVDLVLNRTLVYGALTAVVLAVYIVLVGGLGQLLQGNNIWLAVITTGVVALAINPLRDWLQRRVNRLLYGDQDDPVQLLSKLGAQLEATADPDALLPTLVQTAATALKLPYVAVQLDGADAPIAAHGAPLGATESWPLVYQGAPIGRFHAARRAAHEPFTPREQRLLATIAQQAGAAAHAVQLSADLRRSRQQIVVAREEERRRLRRDLHDGLGPQLATLALQIDAARNVLAEAPDSAESLLQDLKANTQSAIAEVRRVVHDLRPPALDQLGLVDAVRQVAVALQHNGLLITVDAPDALPPLPAAVEVAAYRIVVEALTNAARHAHATHAAVRFAIDDAIFCLTISDNGEGLPSDYRPGVGVASMRERSAELGGTFSIMDQSGVCITVTLPLT